MNFRINPQRARSNRKQLLLGWCRFFLLVGGIVALGYCAAVLFDEWSFQAYQTWRFERTLKAAQATVTITPRSGTSPHSDHMEADRTRAISFGIDGFAGSPLGRLEIPSVGVVAMIMEGVDGKTLRHAVGHIPGTPVPGQPGNVALAGHRDTFFRGLRNIHIDDEITLTTLHGVCHYRVDWTRVVAPEDITVLAPTPNDSLTLVACYPFYYVGPAPKRFIVRADRISE